MREREGDCGKKNRINNFKYLKKVPNEIEFGLYKCNKVWLKIYKKKKCAMKQGDCQSILMTSIAIRSLF